MGATLYIATVTWWPALTSVLASRVLYKLPQVILPQLLAPRDQSYPQKHTQNRDADIRFLLFDDEEGKEVRFFFGGKWIAQLVCISGVNINMCVNLWPRAGDGKDSKVSLSAAQGCWW